MLGRPAWPSSCVQFLSQHPDGELDILSFAGKDASAKFDMIHPLDVIVKYAPEAIIGSLGLVVNQVVLTRPTSQRSHKLLRLVLREGGRRIALKQQEPKGQNGWIQKGWPSRRAAKSRERRRP